MLFIYHLKIFSSPCETLNSHVWHYIHTLYRFLGTPPTFLVSSPHTHLLLPKHQLVLAYPWANQGKRQRKRGWSFPWLYEEWCFLSVSWSALLLCPHTHPFQDCLSSVFNDLPLISSSLSHLLPQWNRLQPFCPRPSHPSHLISGMSTWLNSYYF